MRKSLVLAFAILVGLAVATRPRDAEACGGPSDDVVAAALVVAGAYAGTTIGMGIYDLTADDPSRGYGVVEGLIHTPIALAFGAAFVGDITKPTYNDPYYDEHDDNSELWLGAFTALHATLAIHGWYTAGKSRKPRQKVDSIAPPPPVFGPPGMVDLGPVKGSLTLTPVSDGRSLGGGLGFAGTF